MGTNNIYQQLEEIWKKFLIIQTNHGINGRKIAGNQILNIYYLGLESIWGDIEREKSNEVIRNLSKCWAHLNQWDQKKSMVGVFGWLFGVIVRTMRTLMKWSKIELYCRHFQNIYKMEESLREHISFVNWWKRLMPIMIILMRLT